MNEQLLELATRLREDAMKVFHRCDDSCDVIEWYTSSLLALDTLPTSTETSAPQPPVERTPLSDERITDIWASVSDPEQEEMGIYEFARAVEAAHGIKSKE